MTDLVPVRLRWLTREFLRLKRTGLWSGRLPVRRGDGETIHLGIKAWALRPPLEDSCYAAVVHLLYGPHSEAPACGRVAGKSSGLSPREGCVLQLMAEGLGDKQIAVLLGLSSSNVSKTVCAIMRSMEVASRTEACVMAIKSGFVV